MLDLVGLRRIKDKNKLFLNCKKYLQDDMLYFRSLIIFWSNKISINIIV
uniref:Uncharacterized protein n=1 Tax=Meloidogyne enterolobii TaxID=390850 RepID=A0A6V7V687_MELEN|nr:unnamed protein product [Meloidogyne enterolobii]CAD2169746.1 unnamed protein product [Meloidogyne enterolobii]